MRYELVKRVFEYVGSQVMPTGRLTALCSSENHKGVRDVAPVKPSGSVCSVSVTAVASTLLLCSMTGLGAEIGITPADWDSLPKTLVIMGEIEGGDYEKVIAAIKHAGFIPRGAWLHSPGGDVLTAMRIGRFLRQALMGAHVDHGSQCNSSCVLILLGASTRIALAPVGVHRPYYERDYFADLSATEALEKHKELDALVREYLEEMDVSNDGIELIMGTKSNDVKFISRDDFARQFGIETPGRQEWLLAKCGGLSESEEVDADAADAIDSLEVYEKWLREGTSEASPEAIRNVMAKIAPQAEYGKTLSPGYRDYLQKRRRDITACHIEVIGKHQEQLFERL